MEPTNAKEDVNKFMRQNQKYVVSIQWGKKIKTRKTPRNSHQVTNCQTASSNTKSCHCLLKGDNDRYHHLPITHLDKLLNTQANYCNHMWCERCLHPFQKSCKGSYEKHCEICYTMKRQVEKTGRDALKRLSLIFQKLEENNVSKPYNCSNLRVCD